MAWSSAPFVLSLVVLLLWGPSSCWSQTYEDVQAIYEDKLNSRIYNVNVRPLNNQSNVISIGVLFQLVSVVSINDVTQTFTCNGFLTLFWQDERLSWDPASYGQMDSIYPPLSSIWRPNIVLMNTMDQRDIFQDYKSPLILLATGLVYWSPGGLFPVSCALDLTKYPFDEQTCVIWLIPLSTERRDIDFYVQQPFDLALLTFAIPNGEWELVGSTVSASGYYHMGIRIPDIKVSLSIRRRPTALVLNVILPVVCLSLLNILVFAIPVESGEKISYGITVLLALAVFLSIVGSMLPRSADHLPYVTIYLFSQLVTSVLNVILSIVIVFLYHTDGVPDSSTNVQHCSCKTSTTSASLGRQNNGLSETTQSVSIQKVTSLSDMNSDTDTNVIEVKTETRHAQFNPYRRIGKYLNAISFVSALVLWVAMTAAYFIAVTT